MVCALRLALVCVLVAGIAVCDQDVDQRRQVGVDPERGGRGGLRTIQGRQHQGAHHQRAQHASMGPSTPAAGGGDHHVPGRSLTREERRRFREERRLARLERREERRRQKQDWRRGGEVEAVNEVEDEVEDEVEEEQQDETMMEEVVDVAWLRANLSSLWQELRAFTARGHHHGGRGGGRGRGGGGRGGHASPPIVTSIAMEDHTCPTGVDTCQGADGQVCSGHGQCWCGHCQCEHDHYGSFCQCSDHTCQVYDGMACGGPSRGQCRCGGCMCRPGYVGEACGCPTQIQTCLPPGQEGTQVCSNHGTCECGRCRCEDGYKGMYCEDNVYAAGVCEKLRSCVLCQAWHRELSRCQECQVTLEIVDSLEPSMTTCVMVNAGCLMKYSYVALQDNAYSVMLQRNHECPPQI